MGRAELAGIPVFYAETPPPFVVSALFRVGRADELATTSGKTHLVEHHRR